MYFSRNISISRRTAIILASWGTIALGASAYLTTPRLVEPSIPFHVAVANPEVRQQYIDELVRIEFGHPPWPFVNEFIYDHDISRIKNIGLDLINQQFNDPRTDQIIRKILSDPESLEGIIQHFYAYDSRFTYEEPLRKQAILDFLKSPQAFMDLKMKAKIKSIEDFEYYEEHNLGGTPAYKYDFGTNKKSDIYIFPQVFKPAERSFEGLNIKVPPSSIRVRTIVIHEKVHAKHHYQGINLGSGLKVNHKNFLSIDASLIEYIDEGTAQIVALDFLRQFTGRVPFFYRSYNVEYVDRLLEFYEVFSKDKKLIKEKKLNPFERRLADRFTEMVDPVLAEASDVIAYLKKSANKK